MGRRRFTEAEPSGPIDSLHGAAVTAALDLHGETADSAERKLTWFLQRWAQQQPGAVIRIITGKGSPSRSYPVLLRW